MQAVSAPTPTPVVWFHAVEFSVVGPPIARASESSKEKFHEAWILPADFALLAETTNVAWRPVKIGAKQVRIFPLFRLGP
jgi:hypothetical protein